MGGKGLVRARTVVGGRARAMLVPPEGSTAEGKVSQSPAAREDDASFARAFPRFVSLSRLDIDRFE